jgi:hypothetical protein
VQDELGDGSMMMNQLQPLNLGFFGPGEEEDSEDSEEKEEDSADSEEERLFCFRVSEIKTLISCELQMIRSSRRIN